MYLHEKKFRRGLKTILRRFGLLEMARWFWLMILFVTKPGCRPALSKQLRGELTRWQRFQQYKHQYGSILKSRLGDPELTQKRVLIGGIGFPEVEIELVLIKALEIAGYQPVVMIEPDQSNLKYYRVAGIKDFIFLSEFINKPDMAVAEAAIEHFHSIEELLTFEYAGARVGKVAISTALRRLRSSTLDLQSIKDRRIIVEYIADSMAVADASLRMLRYNRPDLAFIYDGVYTPKGELLDICLANGIDVVIWESAHRNNTLMLKRYTLAIKNEHYSSLSSESWRLLQDIVWDNTKREQLQQELFDTYTRGDWYPSAGTQFDKRFMDVGSLQTQLGLDPKKKTAIIFPHIFWDGSLTEGSDLYPNYEEWFIESIRAACANPRVNWVIKIHPAHVFKSSTGYYQEEPLEVCVLHKNIGKLPSHVFLIPAESGISTFSLFDLMDYCLTVRGTIGIEAARLGIPVLTAGTGRYDRRGFTIDSDSREEYVDRLAHIQEIPRLSTAQRELGERFAYGLFILRPFPLVTVRFEYHKDYGAENGFEKTQINITSPEEWYSAPDLSAFAKWVTDSNNPDFLMPLPDE